MVLTPVWRWFPGWVRVETEGGYPERLLNGITARNIQVWRVQRRGEMTRFCCFARDYRRLRPLARRSCVRMRVAQKYGLPFRMHRYRRRRGLLVAVAVYGVLLLLLAPRIWVVDVVGCEDAALTEQIRAVAAQYGVTVGARADQLQIKQLEIAGMDQLPSLAWMTVNPSGSVARVEVAVRSPTPQVLDLTNPSNLVAVRDGLILSMRVPGGDKRVRVGEAVSAGTLLVSGRWETEQGERLSRSYGEVMAQTRRQLTVTVPLTYWRETVQQTVLRPSLSFLRWKIPLYAETELPPDGVTYTREHFLTAGRLRLPLGITNEYRVLTRQEKTARTEGQAAAIAAARLAEQEQALFSQVEYEEIERNGEINNGQYTLTVTYQCVENIAVEVPLS